MTNEEDALICVDENDMEIGVCGKAQAHAEGRLHRAFSLFIYDEQQDAMLLQMRASGKYHSSGLWANACCSHPMPGEDTIEAVMRRAEEELGLSIPSSDIASGRLRELGTFTYKARVGSLSEHEIDHVFVWVASKRVVNQQLRPDPTEVEKTKWLGLDYLDGCLKKNPEDFAA